MPTMHIYPLHEHDYSILVLLLRDIRLEQGVTQVELAQRLGVPQSLISKVERRERRLDVAELRQVCMALGVPFNEFGSRFESALAVRDILSNNKDGGA